MHGHAAVGRNDVANTGRGVRRATAVAMPIARALTAGSMRARARAAVPHRLPPGRAIQPPLSACSSLPWMPPNPPFDIRTTTSPSGASGHDRRTMSIDRPGCSARAGRVRSGPSTSCSADRRSGSGRLDRNTPAITTSSALPKAAREVVLKHPPARRGRTRLEHGPDAPLRIADAQRAQRLVHRGRMVGEVVEHRDAAAARPRSRVAA